MKALVVITAHQELNCPCCEDTYEDLSLEIWDSRGVKGLERMLATKGGRLVWSEMASVYPLGFWAGVESVLADLWPTGVWLLNRLSQDGGRRSQYNAL